MPAPIFRTPTRSSCARSTSRTRRWRPTSSRSWSPPARLAAFVTDNKADLAGLSDAEIAAAAKAAEDRKMPGKFLIPLQNTTQQPVLQSLTNRDVREKLFNNSLDPRRKGRRQRYTRHHRTTCATARPEGEAAGLSELRGLCAVRPDGQDARSGGEIHRPAGTPATAAKAADEAKADPGHDRQDRASIST